MKYNTVLLRNKKYNVHFGMKALKACGKKWGLRSLNQVQQHIVKVSMDAEPVEGGQDDEFELTFDTIDLLRDLFHTSLSIENKDFPFEPEELIDYLVFENTTALTNLMSVYKSSSPKNEPVDPNARKGRKK